MDAITVQDIAKNCGYSPATFYRQFRDKYDLIAWAYTRHVADIMGRIDGDGYPWRQTLLDGARAFEQGKTYLANLFLHTGGQDSFARNMVAINQRALTGHILSVSGLAALSPQTELLVRLYCLGTVSLTCEWILGQHSATAEELAGAYEQALPAPLHPYLL